MSPEGKVQTTDIKTLRIRSQDLEDQEDFGPEAVEVNSKIASADRADPDSRILLGRALLACNRGAEAVTPLAEALKLDPTRREIVSPLLRRALDWLKAKQEAEGFLAKDGADGLREEVSSRKESTSPYDRRFRLEGRRAVYGEDPSLSNLFGLARECRFSEGVGDGDSARALAESLNLYDEGLAKADDARDRSVGLTGKAKTLLESGRLTEALECGEEAARLEADNRYAYRVLASIHGALAKIEKDQPDEHKRLANSYFMRAAGAAD